MKVSVRHSSARLYKYIGSDDIFHIEHNILRRSVIVRRSLVVTGEDFDRAKQMLEKDEYEEGVRNVCWWRTIAVGFAQEVSSAQKSFQASF